VEPNLPDLLITKESRFARISLLIARFCKAENYADNKKADSKSESALYGLIDFFTA
jgi:hypothetical protein